MNRVINLLIPSPGSSIPISTEARQRKTLNMFLWCIGIAVVTLLLSMVILDLTLPEPAYPGRDELYIKALVTLAGVIIIALIERYVSYAAASIIFNTFLFFLIVFGDTPKAFLTGQSLIYLILPVVTASFLLRPWAGYIIAAIIDAGLVAGAIILHTGVPSIPAMMLFVIIALVVQQSTSNLERSVKQEQKNNHALAESEDRYRKIIATSPNAMVIIDTQRTILECNQAFVKLYGASSREELLGLNSLQLIHPEEAASEAEVMARILQEGRVSNTEVKFLRRDGTTLITEFSAGVIADAEGQPVSIVCIFQDVTEHRRMEIELSKSEKKFSRTFQSNPAPMSISDVDGRYIEVNQAFLRILGYQPEELVGYTPTEIGVFVEPDLNQHAVAIFRETGRLQNFEMAVRTKSGEVLHGLFFAEQLQLGDQPLVLTVMNDITERKKAEDELRISEEQYRNLINLLPVGVCTHRAGRIELINPAGVKMLGLDSANQITGRAFLEFIQPDRRGSVQARFQEAQTSGEAVRKIEEKVRRPDGTSFEAELTAVPFNSSDPKIRLVVFIDITERKQAQEAIALQNQRIQEVSRQLVEVQEREKHRLASELHDDLGQSLTSLKLLLELAAGSRSSEARNKKTEEARELISELMGRVRDLSLDLRPAMLDDFGLFAALRWFFGKLQSQTQIRVQCNQDLNNNTRFEPNVETAAFRIIQEALTNVARHALVQEAQVNISRGDTLCIEVIDRGAGFDSTQLAQKAARSGGISGMQERARLLGGHAEIFSEIGAGTRVRAEIPLTGGEW